MSQSLMTFFIIVFILTAHCQSLDDSKPINNLQIHRLHEEETTQVPVQPQEQIPTNGSQDGEPQKPSNQTYLDCLKDAVGYTATASLIGGGTAAGVGSTAALSAVGFTSGGVAVGTFAAAAQSAIAAVEAGSIFAYLQSAGALATGIFGAAFWPVTIGVGAVAGSGYVYSQCGLPV